MVAIPSFAGTNCEYDTKYAVEKLGFEAKIVWHKESSLPKDTTAVIIPGGFSYGDYLRSGAIARFSPIMRAVSHFAANGGYVLGICNGFQILTESKLLPGALKRNENLHFISSFESVRVESNQNTFLSKCEKGEVLTMPVAHADGNFFCDKETLEDLKANDQVLLRYCDESAKLNNLNGSVEQIAGICNRQKNVFGLMPHPERAIETLLGSCDGVKMLRGFLSQA